MPDYPFVLQVLAGTQRQSGCSCDVRSKRPIQVYWGIRQFYTCSRGVTYLISPKNWRAVLAVLVTVVPTFPGLVKSINPAINVGYASRLFDIAWMYGVSPKHFQFFVPVRLNC